MRPDRTFGSRPGRPFAARTRLLGAAVALLAGCGGGSAPAPGPVSGPAPAPAPAPVAAIVWNDYVGASAASRQALWSRFARISSTALPAPEQPRIQVSDSIGPGSAKGVG